MEEVYSKIGSIPTGSAPDSIVEGCLVLEGGAFRGLYTQGVLDAWMQRGVNFRCTLGVSAGALAGVSYCSGQIGRSARANLAHRHDKDYIGPGALRKSKSLIRLDFLIDDYNEMEPLDEERFNDPRRRLLVETTDCRTGEPLFWERGKCDIFTAAKASASMPFVTPMVEVEGIPCLDGGCSCGIPFDWALAQGYDKIVVIRTRDRAYRKPATDINTAEAVYRRWPAFAKAVNRIPETYNALCDRLDGLEQIGRVFVQAPQRPIEVSRVEGDPEKLGALYWQGYTEGLNNLPALSKYLGIPL